MWKTQKSLFSFSNDWGPGVFWKPVQVSACHGEQESQSTGASLTGTPNPTRRQQLSLHRGGRVQAGRPGTRPRRQLERQPPGLRAVRAAPVPWPYTPAAPKHSEESETQPVTATRSHQGDALLCVVPALGSAVSVEKARFLGGVACGRRGVSPRPPAAPRSQLPVEMPPLWFLKTTTEGTRRERPASVSPTARGPVRSPLLHCARAAQAFLSSCLPAAPDPSPPGAASSPAGTAPHPHPHPALGHSWLPYPLSLPQLTFSSFTENPLKGFPRPHRPRPLPSPKCLSPSPHHGQRPVPDCRNVCALHSPA
ncbi:uncharacterized protein [Vicugna pacos]|uniref:Uncharacterized protein isoform X2 n=1 Tax=Vicugna pacos TaxID=30538 RepID=A0ABM5CDE4_VICPA